MGRALLRKYCSETSGNVGIMMAIIAFTLMVLAGGAVDISKLYKDKLEAQDIADASVLSAALEYKRSRNRAEGRKVANSLIEQNTLGEDQQKDYEIRTTFQGSDNSDLKITSIVSGTTQHAFLGMIGLEETNWEVVAKSQVGVPQVEIILALDVSESMLEGSKFSNMKSSVVTLIESIEPFDNGPSYINVSILPFAENVNLGLGADVLLDDMDGYDYTPNFIGCFRYSDGRDLGDLQAYPAGDVGGAPFCPSMASASLLFSSDETSLVDRVNGMDVGTGTGSDVALRWVGRLLDPAARSKMAWSGTTPKTLTSTTQKYVILLTDGRLKHFDDDQNGILYTQDSADVPSEYQDEFEEFKDQCENLQSQSGVNLYMIGYSASGNIDPDIENELKNCVSGTGQFFAAGTSNLADVLGSITKDLTEIYLTQ